MGEINSYAKLAGFSGKDVTTAVAVAMAESGGNTNAHNSTPPDDSYGLWQINMLGALGGPRRKQFGISSNQELFDPQKNANAAYMIWKGSGWNAWTTYTNGAYKKFTDAAENGSIPGVVDDAKDGLAGVPAAINSVGQNLFKGVANITGILVALVLLILGVVILARGIIPAGKAVKLAKKVVS